MSPCDFWDDIEFEVPRCAYAMLADADVVEQSERQWIAKGMRGPCGSVEIAPGVNMLASPSEAFSERAWHVGKAWHWPMGDLD